MCSTLELTRREQPSIYVARRNDERHAIKRLGWMSYYVALIASVGQVRLPFHSIGESYKDAVIG